MDVPEYQIKTDSDRQAISEGCWWDEDAGNFVAAWFSSYLNFVDEDWAGKPFDLLDWQLDDIILPMFSWKRPDGTRRFRWCFIEKTKKNGKTWLIGSIAAFLLLADPLSGPGTQIYAAANDRQQAIKMYDDVRSVICSGELADLVDISDYHKTITRKDDQRSYFTPLPWNPNKVEGFRGHCIVDEIHVFRNEKLWNSLYYMGRTKKSPLHITITTAGSSRSSFAYGIYTECKDVFESRRVDTQQFVYIAEADEEDDISDPKTWYKANPSLGLLFSEDDFRRDFVSAQASAAKLASWKRYNLNLWVSDYTGWLDVGEWDKGKTDIDWKDFEGQKCCGGLDVSGSVDLTAFSLAFPKEIDDETYYYIKVWYFIPKELLKKKEEEDFAPYSLWVREGHLLLTPGARISQKFVQNKIEELSKIYNIERVGHDQYMAGRLAEDVQDELDIGMDIVSQGHWGMTVPIRELEGLIYDGKIKHAGDPITRWCFDNVTIKTNDAENVMYSKKHSRGRIDGVPAITMAVDKCLRTDLSNDTVYNTRPGRWLNMA